jgi:hypothetical protein
MMGVVGMSSRTFSVLDQLLAPVITPDVARKIIALKLDEETLRLLEELGDKANEGTLTADERETYEAYIEANDLIAIFQAKARRVLAERAA